MKNDELVYDDDIMLLEEDIEHLITEDIDEYVRLAPVHNGRKVISEKAWDTLYEREVGKYDKKSVYTSEEHSELMEKIVEFSNKYECRC